MRRQLVGTLLILAGVLSSGCASHARRFEDFAHAGRQYAETVAALTDRAAEAAIDADSEVLARARGAIDRAERRERYLDQTGAVRELLEVLVDLRAHAVLLARYFTALADLANADAPDRLSLHVQDAVRELAAFRPGLAAAEIGGTSVGQLMAPATEIGVGGFLRSALERRLREDAPVIERELELQRAALAVLTRELREDLDLLLETRHLALAQEYVGEPSLRSRWSDERRELLTTRPALQDIEDAARAADGFKAAFVAMVEGRSTPGRIAGVLEDFDRVLELLQRTRGDRPSGD